MTVTEFPSVLIHLKVIVPIRGSVTFPTGDIVAVFQKHGCPKDLAHRVTADVLAFQSRRTRIMPSVDIEALKSDLAPLGLTVEKLEG